MDVLQAVYRVAHDFEPKGAVGLAAKMGLNPGTFLNRVNPEQDTHSLPIGMAVAMTLAANDFRILHAFADTCGHLAFPKPDYSCVSDSSLLDMVLQRDVQMGALSSVIASAIEDGSINPVEMGRIAEAAYDVVSCTLELVERLKGLRSGGRHGA